MAYQRTQTGGGNHSSGGAAYRGGNSMAVAPAAGGFGGHNSELQMRSASVTAGTGRIVKGTHTWKVDGFSLLSINTPRGGYVESAKFQVGEHWWTLRLYINGEARSGYDALGVYLHLLPSSTYPKDAALHDSKRDSKANHKVVDVVDRVSYRFKAVNQFWDSTDPHGIHRHFCRPVQSELKFLVNTFKTPDDTWGSENFLRRSHILGEGLAAGGSGGLGYGVSAFANLVGVSEEWKGFLVSDTLVLEAELEYADRVEVNSHESGLSFEPLSVGTMLTSLGTDMSALFLSGVHSDVEIIVGDGLTSIPAHKSVLAVRSPVFGAMFNHSMREKQDSTIEIKEFDESVVMMLLEFVYTGQINKHYKPVAPITAISGTAAATAGSSHADVKSSPATGSAANSAAAAAANAFGAVTHHITWERAAALFQAADKYALDQLTLLCVPYITETLSPHTALPTLQMLAARPNCAGTPRLLAATKAYFITHFDAIIPHLNPISAAAGAMGSSGAASLFTPTKSTASTGSSTTTALPSTGDSKLDSKDGSAAAAAAAVPPISSVSNLSRVLAQQPKPYHTVQHNSTSTTAPSAEQHAAAAAAAATAPQQQQQQQSSLQQQMSVHQQRHAHLQQLQRAQQQMLLQQQQQLQAGGAPPAAANAAATGAAAPAAGASAIAHRHSYTATASDEERYHTGGGGGGGAGGFDEAEAFDEIDGEPAVRRQRALQHQLGRHDVGGGGGGGGEDSPASSSGGSPSDSPTGHTRQLAAARAGAGTGGQHSAFAASFYGADPDAGDE